MFGIHFQWRVSLVVLLVMMMTGGITHASEQRTSAVGAYTMGQDDTLQKAQDIALNEAMRTAAEQIGVYVKSYTRMEDSAITKDQVEVSAEHVMKVVSKRFERSVTPSGDIHITAYIDVTYDPDAVLADLQRLMQTHKEEPEGQEITLHLSFGDILGRYVGEVNAAGLPDGQGQFTWMSAKGLLLTYQGAFQNGHFHGQGKKSWSDGSCEEGSFVDDHLHGYGKRMNPQNPKGNYEGNFSYGIPMLNPVQMGQMVEFDDWEYTATRVETRKTLEITLSDGQAEIIAAKGIYMVVYVDARNLYPYTRQIFSSMGFSLLDPTNGKKYSEDVHATTGLWYTMYKKGMPQIVSDIPPRATIQNISFIYDVPEETKLENLYLLPLDDWANVSPIQLRET
jgi:hypothetical protein